MPRASRERNALFALAPIERCGTSVSYLLIAVTLLTFLVLWSKLPEPRSEKTSPETATAVQGSLMKIDPDQIGEPDGHGRIKIGVQNSFGPDLAIPGYVPWRLASREG
jgi:hypothetical protein